MASTSSYRLRASTAADSSARWKYDVFLSFRGSDTRKKFTDHLYSALVRRGIITYRDDPDLERGTTISSELLDAIEQSRSAVVVLSPNYASSTWCLLELVRIVACMGRRDTILPVFYEVEPSDVRYQKGSFAKAFAKHERRFGNELRKVYEWRDALEKVADLSGWNSNDYRSETGLIEEIVDALSKKVPPTFASTEKLFGMDTRLMGIKYLLHTRKASDACFIGIWGMGGIGKTTLATRVLQSISHDFQVSIFLPDVRQVSAAKGLVHLQEQLLCQIFPEKNIHVQNVYDGVAKLKRCLCGKTVLLVLDDVDQLDQLENLAGGKDWFGSESLIIVTTRSQDLLVSHGIEKQYESRGLNEDDALKYFSWRAFKKDKPEEGYMKLSNSILEYAKGLPLALKILGSFLCNRDQDDWESTVAALENAPIDHDIFKVLRISYDRLDEVCQQVFLDVACFLKGNDKERVIEILDSVYGFDTRIRMKVLIQRSLLTISDDNRVDMHDLIQEMGGEIVRLQSQPKPGKRSRLWLRDDIFRVFKENVGTETIRSIALCLPNWEELAWNPNAFSKMSELKFLKMQNLVLCQGPECLPDAIRVLEWTSYPSKSLPPNFQPVELIELILHHSKIDQLWHGIKLLKKLTHIDLSYSENLVMTPDFRGIPNLEQLVLEGCTNLVDIHPSIVSLKRLKILNFKNCRSIENLPGELEMDSLEIVDLSGCSKVNIFPRFVSRMEKLSKLSFGGIGMKSSQLSCDSVGPYHLLSLVLASVNIFPRFVSWMEKLSKLSFGGIGMKSSQVSCDSVGPHHPLSLVLASLKHLCFLKGLNLRDCNLSEGAIPDDIGCLSSLEDLDLSVNNFVNLPASISRLSKLKCLNLANCKKLQQVPGLPLFSGTCHVTVDDCISLQKFPDPPDLCGLYKLAFNFINSSITMNLVSHGIIYSMLQRFLQEPPHFFEMFSIVIPGNYIPLWFSNQSDKDSVRQKMQEYSSCSSKWIGFALCVLIGAEGNQGVLGEDHDLEPHANTISCSWKPGLFVPASFCFDLNQAVKSDHLCLFLLPSKHYPKDGDSDGNIEFVFKTMCATKSNTCLKVKGCGVHALYKQDVNEREQLNFRMNQFKRIFEENLVPHPFPEAFSFTVSGYFHREIPYWFETIEKRDSVVALRRHKSDRRWMGFALCVRFGAEENSGALCEDHDLEPHANKVLCHWKSLDFVVLPSSGYLEQVVRLSDHLCMFFVPRFMLSECDLFRFNFKTSCAHSNACLKVKRCGVSCVYEGDCLNWLNEEYWKPNEESLKLKEEYLKVNEDLKKQKYSYVELEHYKPIDQDSCNVS